MVSSTSASPRPEFVAAAAAKGRASLEHTFSTSNKHDEEDQLDPPEYDQPDIGRVPEGYSMSAVYPPNPCERCVRTNKTCKGIAGARCEYCKRLKQKCSNSTGPARGKSAATKDTTVSPKAGKSESSAARTKRKLAGGAKPGTSRGDGELESEDDGEDEHRPPKMKKRRVAKEPGVAAPSSRAHLLKRLADVESSVSVLLANTTKEMEKFQQIITALQAEVRQIADN